MNVSLEKWSLVLLATSATVPIVMV